uniref:Si:ch211-132g1.3 n=1 Tax=Cyprinus carpio TaxID=7962 RepID=A0A8C1R7S7_CYPCA
MSLRCLMLVVICVVFITTETVSGEEVNVVGEVGGTVSFGSTSINPPVSSIIWKHRKSTGLVVKVIEWDLDDGFSTPNLGFRGITTLNEKTGEINITKLNFEHSGPYTIDINSKQQEQRFNLEVLARVPKPEIKIEKTEMNPNAVYLICEYRETIIWKNSAGETLKGSPHTPKGELITAEKKGNPDVFYTCTLKNAVSESTSDPVYERDLFEEPVPKPEIEMNPNAVNLKCEYNETIIWKNSAGETLKGSPHTPKGELITAEKKGNPDVFYTCTLKNAVSESTSDPVYERDLFEESGLWWIALIVIPVLILALFVLLYKFWTKSHKKQYNLASEAQKNVYENGISDATQRHNR